MSLTDPKRNGRSASSNRYARTMALAERVAANCPSGTEITRLMTVHGKHYELRRWLTSAK